MEKINITLFLICLLVGVAHSKPIIGEKQALTWCIAQAKVPDYKFQAFLDYACGIIDCSAIQPGGPCSFSDAGHSQQLQVRADYALNQYYKGKGTCNTDIGMIITFNPSHGNCIFQ
ncbi:hypothetical protein ABFS82_07G062000 [Erythranthe guttata]|uniref:X8 domain-containing protein n=1 Tax=Erythranthe guttata TaxID=4155 RepID=A0A022QU10_ERYGU|nr:PREDICTED: glucan endo-1,3-beta-glucosidase-like [Erythranthe guttata]EYU31396.1 hypothetical protein MIMGU_mgv1a025951mg [Erythranthe guttata]|eukprot:XP_012844506.1 PREDICTED: glucan endo-1,3-beta-glucosidase-like [Erythranthe guttata]